MILPRGTFKALKGDVSAAVVVVLFLIAISGMAAGAPPWPVVVALALVSLVFYALRVADARRMTREAEREVENAAAQAEDARARFRRQFGERHAALEPHPPGSDGGRPGDGNHGR